MPPSRTHSPATSTGGPRCIARQPILDRKKRLFGYELLFRGRDFSVVSRDPDAATRQVIADGFLTHGLERLTRQYRAFINFPRETLLVVEPGFLPADRVVIEILEDVEPDPEVLRSLVRLKEAGYTLALDDVTSWKRAAAFGDVVAIVKVDLPQTKLDERDKIVKNCRAEGRVSLAEKVETYEEFEAAERAGFQYFQGFFFGRPETLSNTGTPTSKLNYLRVLQVVNAPEFDPPGVTRVIRGEATLCYLLLRYLNSALFSLANEVESVEHAITILGEDGIRRWASLLALSAMSDGKPSELAVTSLVRAAWSEALDVAALPNRDSRFLLGLLSLIDAVLDRPLMAVLDELPLSPEMAQALLARRGPLGQLLDMMEAYERGEWNEVRRLGSDLGAVEEQVAARYLEAVDWAARVMSGRDA